MTIQEIRKLSANPPPPKSKLRERLSFIESEIFRLENILQIPHEAVAYNLKAWKARHEQLKWLVSNAVPIKLAAARVISPAEVRLQAARADLVSSMLSLTGISAGCAREQIKALDTRLEKIKSE
jgi:hypothetical protein